MTPVLLIVGMAVFAAGGFMLAARSKARHVDAVLPGVRAYAGARGHRFADPGRSFRMGVDQSWTALTGEASGLPFQILYSWSRHGAAPFISLDATPVWLPKGGGFDIARERRAQSQWQEAGLWIAGGPDLVAAQLRGPLAPAIAQLAAIPAFSGLNATNVEVPGAKSVRCSIRRDVWTTDAAELDRLIELLVTFCKGR